MIELDDVAKGIADYFAAKTPGATDVKVDTIRRIHGGASRETYMLAMSWNEIGVPRRRDLVVRRDPPSSLIETERATEYNAYTAFHGSKVPVPEPLFLESETNEWLGNPFFVMEAVLDATADVRMLVEEPYAAHVDRIGEQKWRILGEIVKADPATIGLAGKMETPALDACWSRELDHWEKVIDEDEIEPQPVVRAAIRRLRNNPPPPPARLHVVHGDYRSGNFLFNEAGDITAILDWEMCHLGDPHEDLGWALNPLWGWPNPERPGKLIPRDDALRLWEESSGLTIDGDALWWWETFASLKGMAIWLSSAKEYYYGTNRDPIMIFPSWFCISLHNRILAERIAPKEAL